MRRLLIAATAGLTLGALSWAQTDRAPSSQDIKPRFVSAKTILDAKVKARTDEKETGDIDDLVVDTRTGKASYAIIDTNGVLGTDNKTVAIPYGALAWDASNERFTLDVTAEQLANIPKWESKDLAGLRDTSWYSKMKSAFGARPEVDAIENSHAYHGDEYTCYFVEGQPVTTEGTIVSIDKKATTAQGCPCCAIVIEDKSNKEKRTILLAPTEYMTSKSYTPAEGNVVTVGTIEAIDCHGKPVRVAQWVRVDGKDMRLRDAKGIPAWYSENTKSIQPFYILASDMDNGKVYSEGEAFGSVKDVVFEAHSGTAAYAIVSVGGVLGVDDTLYPIPWSAVSLGKDDNLYVHMPTSKLKLAPKLSEDGVKDLNSGDFSNVVVKYYGEEPMRFETDRSTRWSNHRQASANE